MTGVFLSLLLFAKLLNYFSRKWQKDTKLAPYYATCTSRPRPPLRAVGLLLLLFSPPPLAALLTQSQATSSSHAEVITTKGGEGREGREESGGLVHVSAALKLTQRGFVSPLLLFLWLIEVRTLSHRSRNGVKRRRKRSSRRERKIIVAGRYTVVKGMTRI